MRAVCGLANIACFPASFSMIFSTVDLTPKRVPHSTQGNGSSSFKIVCVNAASVRLNWGSKEMAFSGQTLVQRPHWIQASSWNRSWGISGLSPSAPVGHNEAQERQSVQASVSTMTAPYGAPFGSGMFSVSGCMAFAESRAICRLVPIGKTGSAIAAPCGWSYK